MEAIRLFLVAGVETSLASPSSFSHFLCPHAAGRPVAAAATPPAHPLPHRQPSIPVFFLSPLPATASGVLLRPPDSSPAPPHVRRRSNHHHCQVCLSPHLFCI